ncbi:hypothetical protein [Streptomyces sp. TRM49041]|nr:hypothetical protein [Streptomyces sp. TRM49041]
MAGAPDTEEADGMTGLIVVFGAPALVLVGLMALTGGGGGS